MIISGKRILNVFFIVKLLGDLFLSLVVDTEVEIKVKVEVEVEVFDSSYIYTRSLYLIQSWYKTV